MKRSVAAIVVYLTSFFLVISCDDASKQKQYDSVTKGKINISVDESFKPVIEEQIKVYESSFPETKIVATYKSEADCFRDIQNDSTRVIIVARGLNTQEREFFKNNLGYTPQYSVLAYDAVVVVVNKSSNDTLFTLEKLSSYLSGKDSSKSIVLDGKNATSTVRYVMDSLLKGAPFGKNVMAAKSSEEVINFVGSNANAIGLVGLSWIGDSTSPEQREYMKKVKFGLVECITCEEKGVFAKPSQATVTYSQYPLVRGIYFVLKENYTGLGTGFTGFMSQERGQLIFRRAHLVPGVMVFRKRSTQIKEQE
jgi:phosphate transport system substrate-binding protein